MTVRTHTEIYRNYEIRLVEWCGSWQPRPWPLAPYLPPPAEESILAATRPSLEEALAKARWLIDTVLIIHPPEADRPVVDASRGVIRR